MTDVAESQQPPPIEHITQNYVSLKALILSVTERCGKELANVLRTTENLPNDVARKDQFLRFVVACRQEYVKLYVLCKWAVVSGDVSKAIDVANWLHGQVNCFNNVVAALFHLQTSLGPAKSPWADLETALQVLKSGNPLPPSEAKLHLPSTPMSDRDVLQILRRLDTLIALRLALHEHLPAHYRTYEVSNGRARFHLGSSTLWVELSIADENVATQSRFFFVDCGLSGSKTSEVEDLDAAFKLKLEKVVNEQLSTRSLEEVLDWLSMFATVYKLQLLDRQLAAEEAGAGPWAGVISHRYSPTSLIIKYFLDATDSGEVKVNISRRAPYSLVVDAPLDIDMDGPVKNLAVQILSKATKIHAAKLIGTIKAPWINPLSDFSLSLELAPGKSVELAIDTTSGKYSLGGSGPFVQATQQKLSSGHCPLEIFTALRVQVFMDTIASRAEAIGWHAQRNVRLVPDEFSKIAPHTSLLALRLSNTSGWSLCIAIGGHAQTSLSMPTRWFASRLVCVQGRWVLGPIHDVHSSLNLAYPDYSTFAELMRVYSKQFVLFELMRELNLAKIRHDIKHQNGSNVGVVADITTILQNSSAWAQSGLLCTVSDGNITMEGRARKDRLQALGNISEEFNGTEITIDGEQGMFRIATIPGFSDRAAKSNHIATEVNGESIEAAPTAETSRSNNDQLQQLIKALRYLNQAANSLVSAASLGLEVRKATLSSLEVKYADPSGVIIVQNGYNIKFAESNPQCPLSPFLPTVEDHSKVSFGKIITFLRGWYPIWELLEALRSDRRDLNLVVLPQLVNVIRVQSGFDPQAPGLEISLRDFRRQKVVNYIKAVNGAQSSPVIANWFEKNISEGVIPLITGCAVDAGHEHVMNDMVIAIAELATTKIKVGA